MDYPAFLKTAFPLILIPSVCWLSGLVTIRKMGKTSRNLFSGLSAIITILLMIALVAFRFALVVFRYAAPYAKLSLRKNALWFGVTITLFCGVCVFWRAWALYNRETLTAEEIAPYCKAGFLILSGAAASFAIAYCGAA